MNFVLGQKLEMTQTFSVLGDFIPVTKIKVEPNTILRIKDQKKDGYTAVVLGFKNKNKVKKSLMGVFKNFGKFRYVKEFRIDEESSNRAFEFTVVFKLISHRQFALERNFDVQNGAQFQSISTL